VGGGARAGALARRVTPDWYLVPARKEATFLLDTDTLFKSVRNKLLESGKEPVVVALWIIRPDPRSVDETAE
jgi:hypothetical protein